jgi:ATP synthase F1 delta subunit
LPSGAPIILHSPGKNYENINFIYEKLHEEGYAVSKFAPRQSEDLINWVLCTDDKIIKKEPKLIILIYLSDDNKKFVPNIYIVGEELILLRSVLRSSKKLKDFFKNPTYPEQQKLEILLKIFPGLTITTKSFLKVLTERSHLALIPEICDAYTSILLKFQNSTKVKIITASILKESYGNLLLNTLRKLTSSKDIVLNISYNPKLLGGIILEYNSTSIDASILKEFSLFFTE